MFRPRFLVVPLVMKAHFLIHALSFSRACALKLSWLSRMMPRTLVFSTYSISFPFILSLGSGMSCWSYPTKLGNIVI